MRDWMLDDEEALTWVEARCPEDEEEGPGDLEPPEPTPLRERLRWLWTLLGAGACAAVALSAQPAAACFDGYVAQYGDVMVQGGDDVWDVGLAGKLALWLPRMDALLPDGESLEVYYDSAYVKGGEIAYPPGRFDVLFNRLARKLGVPPARRRAARDIERAALTIQIAATRDETRALAMVARLTDYDAPDRLTRHHGFYEAGGFPAENAAVHLIQRTTEEGDTVYQLIVGSFLDRGAAEEAAAAIATDFGLTGFVRRL